MLSKVTNYLISGSKELKLEAALVGYIYCYSADDKSLFLKIKTNLITGFEFSLLPPKQNTK
jgi:hypothetical protein